MVITTVLAFFFCLWVDSNHDPGKGLFYTVSTFPLIAPSIIQGLALILLFGRNGLVTRYVLHTDWNIYGATGSSPPNVFTVFQMHSLSFIPPFPPSIRDWMKRHRAWAPLPKDVL